MNNPIDIISEFYDPDSKAYKILIQHGGQVAGKAVEVACRVPHLSPDLKFIEEAAMLHDIGIFLTNAPGLGCTGEFPYIFHGYLGRKILEKRPEVSMSTKPAVPSVSRTFPAILWCSASRKSPSTGTRIWR